MKWGLVGVFLIVCAGFACAPVHAGTAKTTPQRHGGRVAGVQFSLTFEKTEYKRSDPIPVGFSLEHRGPRAVWINKRFLLGCQLAAAGEGEVMLEITAPTGEQLPCKANRQAGFPKTDFFELLQPGQTVASEHPYDLKGYVEVASPGIYTIVGVYGNMFGKELGLDTFRGPVRSKPVTITIVE